MRKLFRMQYEPCEGRCYAPEDVLNMNELGADVEEASKLLDRIIEIHEHACGNEHISYTLDVEEENSGKTHQSGATWFPVFVAGFWHYGSVELFAGWTALEVLNKLIDAALSYYQTEEYARLVAERPGKGHEVCEHGEDQDLRKFAIRFSGLSEEAKHSLLP